MRRRLILLLLIVFSVNILAACGSKGDTGILIEANDNNNDSASSSLTEGVDDSRELEQADDSSSDTGSDTSTESDTNDSISLAQAEVSRLNNDTILGGWVSSDGDAYDIRPDNTFSNYIIAEDKNITGIYETDDKTYITFKYNDESLEDNKDLYYNWETGEYEPYFNEEGEIIHEKPGYTTSEIVDIDGVQYIEYYDNEEVVYREPYINSDITEYQYELTYEIKRGTITDDFNNQCKVTVLSKGDNSITLRKSYDIE